MVQIIVTYLNHEIRFYPVSWEEGWRIDSASRCIVIGKFPRRYIPLDSIAHFDVKKVNGTD